MAREELSGQEQQVNLIIERIQELIGDKLKPVEIADMIRQVIEMRENGGPEEAIRHYISSKARIDKNDEKAHAILDEIAERPFQNNYHPFKNNLLEQLKKDLEKE
jgi:hypothetical protein